MENNTEFVNDEVTDVVCATDEEVASEGRGINGWKAFGETLIIGGAVYGIYHLGKSLVRKIRKRWLNDAKNFDHNDAGESETADEE